MSRHLRLNRQPQAGFTIIELMIATLVFSAILLSATGGLLQIGKLYYKGVISNRTQETTRGFIDQVSQQLQFTSESVVTGADNVVNVNGAPGTGNLTFHAFCIGTNRYSYIVNTQVNSSVAGGSYDAANNRLRHALWRDTVAAGNCTALDLSKVNPSLVGSEQLQENMRLSNLLVPSCYTTNICHITVGVIYGDNDLVAPTSNPDPAVQPWPDHCQAIIGSQWCSYSQYTTTVLKRVGN